MCSTTCLNFAKLNIKREDIEGKSVLEVGSLDLNGSFRSIVEEYNPNKYVGVDLVKGPGVDEICDVINLIKYFGSEKFDVLIATELLEHVKEWKIVVNNFKKIVKPDGLIFITTRSKGFPYHGFPLDFWRYEISDIKNIFSDCTVKVIQKDTHIPGLFTKIKKNINFKKNNIENYKLYSIIKGKKIIGITNLEVKLFLIFYWIKENILRKFPKPIKNKIKKILKIT